MLGNIASKFLIGSFQSYIYSKPQNDYHSLQICTYTQTSTCEHVKLMTGPLSSKSILDVILLELA